MEFKVIDQHIHQTFEEILRRIKRLQSGGTIDSIREIGANPGNQVGASYLSLKNLASQYSPDESLALLLWNWQKREEQIIACLLFPLDTNKEKITQLISTSLNYEIAGYVGSLHLCHRPDILSIAALWSQSDQPFLQLAALTALSRYIILHKGDSDKAKEILQKALKREYEDKYVKIAAERYRFNI